VTKTDTREESYFNDDVATFGDRLEAARLAKGLSPERLAQKIGVKAKTVHAWENDTTSPRANKIQMLAGLLNVSIMWLISGQGNGTLDVVTTFDRPEGMNDAIGEMRAVKQSLIRAIDRIEQLEARLEKTT